MHAAIWKIMRSVRDTDGLVFFFLRIANDSNSSLRGGANSFYIFEFTPIECDANCERLMNSDGSLRLCNVRSSILCCCDVSIKLFIDGKFCSHQFVS